MADSLLARTTAWLEKDAAVKAAILFGSSANDATTQRQIDAWSDYDIQVICDDPSRFEGVDWAAVFPEQDYRYHSIRPATGGTRKITILFGTGQLDLVIVPVAAFVAWREAMFGPDQKKRADAVPALNEIYVCIRTGHRFLKGQADWNEFYQRILAEMTGVRLSDAEIEQLARVFLCDLLWVFQKIERGELVAAQFVLHRSLVETNLRLSREARLRRGERVPSFGLGRRVESLLPDHELPWVQVSATLTRDEQKRAAWQVFHGFKALAHLLVPTWEIPASMMRLLEPFRSEP